MSQRVKGTISQPCNPGDKMITITELSEYLRVHRSTFYRLMKKGLLPGSDWRFNGETVDEWRLRLGAAQREELLQKDWGNVH
jgi:excisionase family DNA binding protein